MGFLVGVLAAILTAAGLAIVQAYTARKRLGMSPQAIAAEHRDELAELEQRLAVSQGRYGQLWADLAACEDDQRILKRRLDQARWMLRERGVPNDDLP